MSLCVLLAETPLTFLDSLGENARYGAAALAWLVVGGGAWWFTRLSLRKAEKPVRGRAGRAAFFSSGLIAALAAFFLGGGMGLGGGEGASAGEALSPSEEDKTQPPLPATKMNPEPVSQPSQEKITLSIQRDASGKVGYLLGDTPIEPGRFEETFRAFYQQNPALKEVELLYHQEAPAADVLAIQRVISGYPGLAYTVRPSE